MSGSHLSEESPQAVLVEVQDRLNAVCRRIDELGSDVPWFVGKLREFFEPSRLTLAGSPPATSDLF